MHIHPHSQSGTDHNHEHSHAHTHEHLHGETADHDHAHTPMAELLALMKYMTGHNAAHTEELAELAHKLDDAGNHAAYHKVMEAVASFQNGNAILAEVLKELEQ